MDRVGACSWHRRWPAAGDESVRPGGRARCGLDRGCQPGADRRAGRRGRSLRQSVSWRCTARHGAVVDGSAAPDNFRRKAQACGRRSEQSLRELVGKKQVELAWKSLDRYGRPIAQVSVDGLDVNAEQVRRGYAWVFRRYSNDPRTRSPNSAERLEFMAMGVYARFGRHTSVAIGVPPSPAGMAAGLRSRLPSPTERSLRGASRSLSSVNRAWRQSRPTPYRDWRPAERFVTGPAPRRATRPFVDVQSVLCRTTPSRPPAAGHHRSLPARTSEAL